MSELLKKAQRELEASAVRVNTEFRPESHLCVPGGWLNDPNGFGFYQERCHLFYQFHPYGAVWGPMHWGHWSSKDLVHWQIEPVALAPDQPYDAEGCFSGTTLVVGKTLYVVYTGVSKPSPETPCIQQQCLAWSRDGIHFEKWSGNPILGVGLLPEGASPNDFRDPKIYRDDNCYHIIAASRGQHGGQLLHFVSDDLFTWSYAGVYLDRLGEMVECPDVFTLDGQETAVVCLMGMDPKLFGCHQPVVYTSGHVHQKKLEEARPLQLVDHGMDFYAPQTTALPDGRRVMIGWAFTWEHQWPTKELEHGWAGMMTLPRECRMQNGKLFQQPLRELVALRSDERSMPAFELIDDAVELPLFAGSNRELLLIVSLRAAECFTLQLMKTEDECVTLNYDTALERLLLDLTGSGYDTVAPDRIVGLRRAEVPLSLQNGKLQLRIFVDHSILEVYAGEEAIVMTALAFPRGKAYGVQVSVKGHASFEKLRSWRLGGII